MSNVKYSRPNGLSFIGIIVGCDPIIFNAFLVKREDTGEIVSCDGVYLTEID